MNCFNMDQKDIIANFTNFFKEELKLTYKQDDVDKFNFSEPIYLTSSSIQKIMGELEKDQQSFKSLINSFSTLNDREKIKLVTHFCSINTKVAQKVIFSDYPISKSIKTNYYIGSNSSQFKALANVCAKKGVKLSKYKTYKNKEIEELLNAGKIIIVNFEPYGKNYSNKKVDFYEDDSNLLNLSFHSNQTSESGYSIQMKDSVQITRNLIENINFKQLKTYYQKIYLEIYKNCLNYLIKCTEFSTTQENKNLQDLQEQINELPKKIEQNQTSIDEISKLIIDSGRE